MNRTVRQLMEERTTELVGMSNYERAVLRQLKGDDGPIVVFEKGIAGAASRPASTPSLSRRAKAAQLWCVSIAGRSRRQNADFSPPSKPRSVATSRPQRLRLPGSAVLPDRVVLVLDTYELLRMLDSWLRQAFVVALTDNVRIAFLAGRDSPMTGWPSELGELFRSVPLGSLSREDAEAFLRHVGVDRSDAARINHVARGHPLSLRLAASAMAERPDISVDAVTVKAIVEELTELYLEGLESLTRQALDAAAVIRRPTLSLLAAMLPEAGHRTP